MRPSRRLDKPSVDPECLAELLDETPDVGLLPAWMRRPAPGLPLTPRKAPALAEVMDGPSPEPIEALLPDQPGEVDDEALPRWMRGQPGYGPPDEEEAQTGHGSAQHDSSAELPEWDW